MRSPATAREVFDAHPGLREAVAAVPTDSSPAAYLSRLLASGTPEDAIAFCAYALPEREAVWWATNCVTTLQAGRLAQGDDRLRVAQDWMRSPGDRERRAALAAGLSSDRRSPATWVALAAGWSAETGGGAPAGGAPADGAGSTARAVATAILDALARVSARDRADRLNACVRIGIQLLGRAE